jgi:hypothetical protein
MIRPGTFLAFFAFFFSAGCADIKGGPLFAALPQVCGELDHFNEKSPINLNQDFKRHDQLLGLSGEWGKTDIGGIMWFEKIPMATIAQLYDEKFLDPFKGQNASPNNHVLLAFMCEHSSSLVSGYAVSPKREDYRVTINAIQIPSWSVNSKVKSEYEGLCKDADELDITGDLYCWWD